MTSRDERATYGSERFFKGRATRRKGQVKGAHGDELKKNAAE